MKLFLAFLRELQLYYWQVIYEHNFVFYMLTGLSFIMFLYFIECLMVIKVLGVAKGMHENFYVKEISFSVKLNKN